MIPKLALACIVGSILISTIWGLGQQNDAPDDHGSKPGPGTESGPQPIYGILPGYASTFLGHQYSFAIPTYHTYQHNPYVQLNNTQPQPLVTSDIQQNPPPSNQDRIIYPFMAVPFMQPPLEHFHTQGQKPLLYTSIPRLVPFNYLLQQKAALEEPLVHEAQRVHSNSISPTNTLEETTITIDRLFEPLFDIESTLENQAELQQPYGEKLVAEDDEGSQWVTLDFLLLHGFKVYPAVPEQHLT